MRTPGTVKRASLCIRVNASTLEIMQSEAQRRDVLLSDVARWAISEGLRTLTARAGDEQTPLEAAPQQAA